MLASDDYLRKQYGNHVKQIVNERRKHQDLISSRNYEKTGFKSFVDKNRQLVSYFNDFENQRRSFMGENG